MILRGFILYIFSLFLFPILISYSQIPTKINFQGILTDTTGTAIVPNGNYSITFKIYETPTGGSAQWTETQDVSVYNGLFSVYLGAVNKIDLPFDKKYWLGITINNGEELSPRIELTAVPYSLISQGIINGAVTTEKIADSAVVASKIKSNSITTEKIIDGSITQSKLAPGLSLPPGGTAGGDLTGNYPNPLIADGKITTQKLADSSVTTAKI